MFLKNYLKDKSLGFWFTIVVTFLFLLTGILFVAIIPGLVDYARYAYVGLMPYVYAILFGGAALSVVGIVLRQYKVVPYIQGVLALIALLMYVYISYKYVFEIFMAIEDMLFYPQVIVLAVLVIAILGLSIAGIFLKQTKTIEEVSHE